MPETTLKIALAGLMHDIGKFAQGSLPVSRTYLDDNAGLYQPFRDNHYTHVHAVYTAAFIEQMADRLPHQCNAPAWGEGDAFVNLAAGHHKPDTPMQWIVAEADRISSGLDRDTFEQGEKIAFRDVQKTRLLPVLEAMGPERCTRYDRPERYAFSYPLAPLTAGSIFPRPRQEEQDRAAAAAEYQELFDGFSRGLAQLQHRDRSVALWARHFDSLLMTWTSAIPAARVGDVVHDVSLYDHCRTAAALAAALYAYHAGTGTLDVSAIQDRSPQKFLLVSGDFYGIQDFIFARHGESRRYRSKLLRGRSFAVSLMIEAAIHLFCEALDLPLFAVLLQAAGKFHLLAPNLPGAQEKIARCEAEINDWLFAQTYGTSSLGIACTPAAPAEFHAGAFRRLWDRHLAGVERRKYRKIDMERHGGVVAGFLDSFNNDIPAGKRLCPLCGTRPSVPRTVGDRLFRDPEMASCALCRDHVYLGTNLVKGRMVALCRVGTEGASDNNGLLAPVFDRYQVRFTGSTMDEAAAAGQLLALWQTGVEGDGSLDCRATVRLINGHVPRYRPEDNEDDCLLASARADGRLEEMIDQIKEGDVKTFGHLAVKARHQGTDGKCHGVEALGVLKADVDNLGMLFGCGLTDSRFTLSRLATVSRQLDNFFALYLPYLLAGDQRFHDVYTVFAGGDDLFLVGPWNRMADLAALLRQRFADYVCHNPEITFSAGITVHKPNVPVDAIAEAAEEALAEAKRRGRNRVVMFGQAIAWDDFADLLAMRAAMQGWLDADYISDVMFYRFNHLVDMAETEARLGDMTAIDLHDMNSVKWRALLRYSLARNVCKGEKREKALEEVGRTAAWIDQYRGGMRVPLWHVLYEKRG